MHIKCLTTMLVMFLGGCASGASEFTCGEFPQGTCQPVSLSYEASNAALEDYDYRGRLDHDNSNGAVQRSKSSSKSGDSVATPVVQVSSISTALNHAVSGDPIYSQPVVLRILFNDWQDENGNLHSRNYVYHVIRESEWLIVD